MSSSRSAEAAKASTPSNSNSLESLESAIDSLDITAGAVHNRRRRLVVIGLTCAFVIWSAGFIYRSSFMALDGARYFSLFDDAMISMRYAWNLSHGNGLVWNAGERVQGYTNL
jgi:hypothetical protein